MLSRGLTFNGLDHRDLLDIAYALFLEPLAGDPKARAEAIAKLGEPLPGSRKAIKKVTREALAAVGLTPELARKQLTERKKKREAKAAAEADQAGTATP